MIKTFLPSFKLRKLTGEEKAATTKAEVIATALSCSQQLGQPFACRTSDRLETYLNEEKKIDIKRSRIDEL
jgi:hypothetical protein